MIQAGAMRNGNTVDAGFSEGRSHKKSRHLNQGAGSSVELLAGGQRRGSALRTVMLRPIHSTS